MKKGMMFYKVFVLVLVGILIFAIQGCQQQPDDLAKTVHVGTKGLTMAFIENNPPNKITASTGGEFNLGIELKNEGTAPTKGRLFLSGFDTNIIDIPDFYEFPNPDNCGTDYIGGRTKFNSAGETCIENINGLLNLNPVVDYIDFPLMVTAMYQYVTDTSVMVCIDPNFNQIGKKACLMKPVSVSGGQGAPIAITGVEPIPVGKGKIQFQITVQNVGGGKVVDVTKAPHELTPRDYDYLIYEISVPSGTFSSSDYISATGYAVEGGRIVYDGNGVIFNDHSIQIIIGGSFNAAGVGKVRLYNNKAVITQTIDVGDKAFEYITPLRVTLYYGYMDFIQKTVSINKIPDDEADSLFPEFGFAGHELYSIRIGGKKYLGYHEDPNGHDVWRYTDKDKKIDIILTTT